MSEPPCRHDAKWIADFTKWVIKAHEQRIGATTNLTPASSSLTAKLAEALEWAMKRLDPYTHEPECSPLICKCGYWKAREALARLKESTNAR